MYNHLSANGGMPAELVAKLFALENITGVKWTLNNYYGMMELKRITEGKMNIINGPDEMLLQGLSAGADAGIGTTYNVMLPMYKEIYRAFCAGDMEKAMVAQRKADSIIAVMFRYEVLPATKFMCKLMGCPIGDCTRPFRKYTPEEEKALEADLLAAGWDPKTGMVN
jgi:N-acetylneuraminate lyase